MSGSRKSRNLRRNCTGWSSSITPWSSNRIRSRQKCSEQSTRKPTSNWSILPVSKSKLPRRTNLKPQTNSRTPSSAHVKPKPKSWNPCNSPKRRSPWSKANLSRSARPWTNKPKAWETCRTRTISSKPKKSLLRSARTLTSWESQLYRKSTRSFSKYPTRLPSWCTSSRFSEKSSKKQSQRIYNCTGQFSNCRISMLSMPNC